MSFFKAACTSAIVMTAIFADMTWAFMPTPSGMLRIPASSATARGKSASAGSRRESAARIVMAAAKKGGPPAFKGFGGLPDALRTRMPDDPSTACACCSGMSYKDCCSKFHAGEAWPSAPLELMRSRYTGYAYRLPDWICDTTHKTNVDWQADKPKWKRELLGFCDGFDFLGLDVVEETNGADENEYFIEFLARLRTRNQPKGTSKGVKETFSKLKSQVQNDQVNADFKERSRFLKEDGRWLYVAGDVDFDPKIEIEGGKFVSAGNMGAKDAGNGGMIMGPSTPAGEEGEGGEDNTPKRKFR